MSEREFVDALRGLMLESWADRNYLAWFVLSAALAGARLGAWIRTGERL